MIWKLGASALLVCGGVVGVACDGGDDAGGSPAGAASGGAAGGVGAAGAAGASAGGSSAAGASAGGGAGASGASAGSGGASAGAGGGSAGGGGCQGSVQPPPSGSAICDLRGSFVKQCHSYPSSLSSAELSSTKGACSAAGGTWTDGGTCPSCAMSGCEGYSNGTITLSTYYYQHVHGAFCAGTHVGEVEPTGDELVGSCLEGAINCTEYHGGGLFPDELPPECAKKGQTHSAGPCTHVGMLGTCSFGKNVTYTYPGSGLTEAMCKAIGGTWAPAAASGG